MPIKLIEETGGKILIVQGSGKLVREDHAGPSRRPQLPAGETWTGMLRVTSGR